MEKNDAREIIMAASQRAMALFRVENPLPSVFASVAEREDYFNRQVDFINGYITANVSEETQAEAI